MRRALLRARMAAARKQRCPGGVRAGRPAPLPGSGCSRTTTRRHVGGAADRSQPGQGRDRQLRHRLARSRLPGPAPGRAQLRRRRSVAPSSAEGHGASVAGEDRGEPTIRGAVLGIAYSLAGGASVAKVVNRSGDDSARRGSGGDPLGRGGGGGVINLSLGGVRDPVHRGPRHVLVARGGDDGVRVRAKVFASSRRSARSGERGLGQPWPFAS